MTTTKYTKEDIRPTWVTVDDNTFFDDEGRMVGVVNPTILVEVEVGGVERGCACFQLDFCSGWVPSLDFAYGPEGPDNTNNVMAAVAELLGIDDSDDRGVMEDLLMEVFLKAEAAYEELVAEYAAKEEEVDEEGK